MKKEIPFWEKSNLTIEEAAAYFGIGLGTLRRMARTRGCQFVLWIGRKCLIKRRCLEDYLKNTFSIAGGERR